MITNQREALMLLASGVKLKPVVWESGYVHMLESGRIVDEENEPVSFSLCGPNFFFFEADQTKTNKVSSYVEGVLIVGGVVRDCPQHAVYDGTAHLYPNKVMTDFSLIANGASFPNQGPIQMIEKKALDDFKAQVKQVMFAAYDLNPSQVNFILKSIGI